MLQIFDPIAVAHATPAFAGIGAAVFGLQTKLLGHSSDKNLTIVGTLFGIGAIVINYFGFDAAFITCFAPAGLMMIMSLPQSRGH